MEHSSASESISTRDSKFDVDQANHLLRHSHVAVETNRLKAFLQCSIHLLPVTITSGILALNLTNIFWMDAGNERANEYRAGLQVVSKIHETLIVFSLLHFVLYHLRRSLIFEKEISYPLFSTAYRASLGGQIIGEGLLRASWVKFINILSKRDCKNRTQYGSTFLTAIVIASVSLAVMTGPASAIALLPRLQWWPWPTFWVLAEGTYTNAPVMHDFTFYIPKKLFPNNVTNAVLPGPFCVNSTLDMKGACPYAGLQELNEKGTIYDFNFTIGNNMARRMISGISPENPASSHNRVTTKTTSAVLADYLGLAFTDGFLYGDAPPVSDEIDSYFTLEMMIDGKTSKMIASTAYCSESDPTNYERDITPLLEASTGRSINSTGLTPEQVNVTIDIRNVWDENFPKQNYNKKVDVHFRRHNVNPTQLSTALAFVFHSRLSGNSLVDICTISAQWKSNPQWVISTGEHEVMINSHSAHTSSLDPGISLQESWLNAFLAVQSDSNMTVIGSFLVNGLERIHDIPLDSRPNYGDTGDQFSSTIIAGLLSRAVADGLARIGSEYAVSTNVGKATNVTVCREGWCTQGPLLGYKNGYKGSFILNCTHEDCRGAWDRLLAGSVEVASLVKNNTSNRSIPITSFLQPENIDEIWTRIDMPAKRYGYGYGFVDGKLTSVIISATVLIFEAVIIIIHCVFVVVKGQNFNFIGNLSDLLELALRSKLLDGGLGDTGNIILKEDLSRKVIRARAMEQADGGERLELQVNERKRESEAKG